MMREKVLWKCKCIKMFGCGGVTPYLLLLSVPNLILTVTCLGIKISQEGPDQKFREVQSGVLEVYQGNIINNRHNYLGLSSLKWLFASSGYFGCKWHESFHYIFSQIIGIIHFLLIICSLVWNFVCDQGSIHLLWFVNSTAVMSQHIQYLCALIVDVRKQKWEIRN